VNIDKKVADYMELYAKAGIGAGGIEPTAENWKAVLEYPSEGKVYLVTQFIFTDNPVDAVTRLFGAEYFERYAKFRERLGAKDIFSGAMTGMWTGEDDAWQTFQVTEFPNREAVLAYVTDPLILETKKVRGSFIAKQRSFIVKPDE